MAGRVGVNIVNIRVVVVKINIIKRERECII